MSSDAKNWDRYELVFMDDMNGLQAKEFVLLTQPKIKKRETCFNRKKELIEEKPNVNRCLAKYLEVVLGIYQCSVIKPQSLFFCGLDLNPPGLVLSFVEDQPNIKTINK